MMQLNPCLAEIKLVYSFYLNHYNNYYNDLDEVNQSLGNRKIASGYIELNVTDNNEHDMTVNISSYHFTEAPNIVCSPIGSGYTDSMYVKVYYKDKTKFQVQYISTKSSSSFRGFDWIAIGK